MLGGTRIPLLLAGSAIESRLAAVAGIGLKARCGAMVNACICFAELSANDAQTPAINSARG
jgi:hypothetical protein